jgi:hypothetical protein
LQHRDVAYEEVYDRLRTSVFATVRVRTGEDRVEGADDGGAFLGPAIGVWGLEPVG